MKTNPNSTPAKGSKCVKLDKLESRSSMADVGGDASDLNRIRNQYAKNPPVSDEDFMGAFMGKVISY